MQKGCHCDGGICKYWWFDTKKIEYEVVPHTVVYGEIANQQLNSLKGMPSLSYRYGNDQMRYIYFMPPVLYPDGKHYVKIGHSFGDSLPINRESLTHWFQSDGDMTRVEWLTDTLKNLIPGINFKSFSSKSCVTSRSPTGKQYIDQFEDTQIFHYWRITDSVLNLQTS